MRQRLKKQRLWNNLSEAVCEEWLCSLLDSVSRRLNAEKIKAERSAPRERQMELFPGFEALPTRIRSGRNYLEFPEITVSQFLEYAERYQKRSQKSYVTAAELRRLAEKVKPYVEIDPNLTVAAAFERAEMQPRTLAVVTKRG